MCLILLAYEAHPAFRLVLAANRDEFYTRPSAAAHFWPDAAGVLAGRDLERGGTWLGVTRAGRIAAVTNYREPGREQHDAPSRGALVAAYLQGDERPGAYLAALAWQAAEFNGFNLLVGTPRALYYYSNRGASEPQRLKPGVHGLSNHLLDTPWPKVARGQAALERLLAAERTPDVKSLTEGLFSILAERAQGPDELLPQTGVGLELERVLSSAFITSPTYGTRSSTVLLIARSERVTFIERTFTTGAHAPHEVVYQFEVQTICASPPGGK